MIALDTNVLVRFLVNDDQVQSKKAYELFVSAEENEEVLFLSSLVILETLWVLESCYSVTREGVAKSIGSLILMPVLKFEHHSAIQSFVEEAKESSYDLSDLLILNCSKNCGCQEFVTFDKKASKHGFARLLN